MADSASSSGQRSTNTRTATATPSSTRPPSSSASSKSRSVSATGSPKRKGSTSTPDSVHSSATASGTSMRFAKGVGHTATAQSTDVSSSTFTAAPLLPTQPAPTDNGASSPNGSSSLNPGIIAAIVVGAFLIILLPIIVLCLRRQRIVLTDQRTSWWRRRRPLSTEYDDHAFASSSTVGHTNTTSPTPTPQWATGSHIYRPGDPPILPEDDEIYLHTLRSKLALEPDHDTTTTRTTLCPSAASTVSHDHDSSQRLSPALDARRSRASLPLGTYASRSGDPSSSLSPPTPTRVRTISLRPICLSDYPPIPPLPRCPPPPPPFPRAHPPESYVFVVADPFSDPSSSTS